MSKTSISTVLAAFVMLLVVSPARAAPCSNNSWQPTFVHDIQHPDGPWYVMPNGHFRHLRIRNRSWVAHACALIAQYGLRNRRGYTNCQAYTRVQCGCTRAYSGRNSTCRSFMRAHKRKYSVKPY